jgi:transposase, IS30 family
MKSYQQLTQNLRYQIYAFLKADFTLSHIAREIGVHKSTISRELKRNRGGRGYPPKQAQQLAHARRKAKENATRIKANTSNLVESFLAQDWSPEQIRGTLKAQGQPTVSHECIYQHILADKQL